MTATTQTIAATVTRHQHLLSKDDEIIDFVTAGKAIFTIKNRNSGNRATYRVEGTGEGDARTYKVLAFTGTNNDNHNKGHFTTLGTLSADGVWHARTATDQADDLIAAIARQKKGHWVDNKAGFITRCRSSLAAGNRLSPNQAYRFNGALRKYKVDGYIKDELKLVIFPWFWARLMGGRGLPEIIEVWHEGRCGYCARKLTVPASIELGMGPDCAGDHGRKDEWVALDAKLGKDLVAYGELLAERTAAAS